MSQEFICLAGIWGEKIMMSDKERKVVRLYMSKWNSPTFFEPFFMLFRRQFSAECGFSCLVPGRQDKHSKV